MTTNNETNSTKLNESPDMTKPPANCSVCNGEREWSVTPHGKPVAVCYFCGKAESVKAEGTPKFAVAAFGRKADRTHGFIVTANLDKGHSVRIHVIRTRADELANIPVKTTVSWPSIGSTTADNARTIAEALAKAANLADRLEKASE